MTLFLVFREKGLPENSEVLVSDYLKNKFKFSKIFNSYDSKIMAFLSDNCDIQKDHNNFQIIWGEVTSIEDNVVKSKKNVHKYIESIWDNYRFSNFSNIDGSWGFFKYVNNNIYFSKGAFTSSSVSPDLFYFKENNFLYISSNINFLVSLATDTSYHMGAVLSSFRFGSPSPGRTLLKVIRRAESGNIYTYSNNNIIVSKNIFKIIKKSWWEKYSKTVSLQEATEDLYQVNLQNMINILPESASPAITLSGGIDSACSAISISKTKFKDKWLGIYGNKKGEDFRKGKDQLSELEASRFVANKKSGKHMALDMMDYVTTNSMEDYASSIEGFCWPTGYLYRLLALAAKNNDKDSIVLGSGEDLAPASYIFQEYLLKKKLDNNFFGKIAWKLLQKLSANRVYRGVASKIINKKDIIINPHGEITWYHEQISSILLNRFLNKMVIEQDLIESGAVVLPKKNIYDQLPIKSVWAYVSAINYDRTLPDLWAGIAGQASAGTGVKIYNIFAGQHFAKFITALPRQYKTGEGFPKTQGKDNWNKFLFRKLVNSEIGPEVAWRERYGFSNPIWYEFREKLKMDEVINDVKIFEDQNVKKKILLTHPRKHHWTMFCLAKIREKLNSIKKDKIFN